MEPVRYTFPKRANATALRDELLAAGIPVAAVRPFPTYTDVDLFPEDFDRAATVVQAHDAAAIDAAEATARTKRQQARAIILAYPDLTTPTNAQTVAAVKALCLAVAALYRED